MKYKTSKSIFPSPDTKAEKIAEAVYYAEPDTRGGSDVVIPKTAPIIEAALKAEFTRGYEQAISVLRNNLCSPYTKGSCEECDSQMRDIERLEKYRSLVPNEAEDETAK